MDVKHTRMSLFYKLTACFKAHIMRFLLLHNTITFKLPTPPQKKKKKSKLLDCKAPLQDFNEYSIKYKPITKSQKHVIKRI